MEGGVRLSILQGLWLYMPARPRGGESKNGRRWSGKAASRATVEYHSVSEEAH